jgi:hypothetical protein
MKQHPLLFVGALLLLLPSCAKTQKPAPEPAMLQHIAYHRSGGIAGFDDRLEIQPDGRAAVAKRGSKPYDLRLTQAQLDRLREQFAGLSTLQSDYPAPPRAADDFKYELTYGDRRVTASEANADVPQRLRELWSALDAIALQQP